MSEVAKKPSLITPEFRVAFPQVFTPKKNDLNGKDEYSIVAIFPPGADLKALYAAAADAIAKKWPNGKPATLKSPFRKHEERKQEDGTYYAGYEDGGTFINLRTTRKPGVVDQANQPMIDMEKFYAGCYAKAAVSVFAYEARNKEGKVVARGVSFGLVNIQKQRDGEMLTGSNRKAEEEFTPVVGAEVGGDASAIDNPFN